MKYIQQKVFINIIVVIFLMLCINVTFSWFNLPNYQWLPFFLDAGVILIYIIKNRTISIKPIYIKMITRFFLPLLIPSIIAAITAIIIYHNTRYTMSSFKYILWAYGAYLFGYFLIKKFGLLSFDLLLAAGTISYLTVIVRVVILNESGVSLEVHELTYLYAMLFVFYLTCSGIEQRKRVISLLICVIGIFLGGKRVIILSLGAGLLVYLLFNNVFVYKIKWLKLCALISIAVCFGWIYLIKSGIFEQLCMTFNINDMSRLVMWNFFQSDYSFSPLYLGRGLSYTDVVMTEVHHQLYISTAIPIHNFVLKAYIGWGFVPFLYYLFNFFYGRVADIAKNGKIKEAWILLSISIIICVNNFFGDNMLNIGTSILYGMIWSLFMQTNKTDNSKQRQKRL